MSESTTNFVYWYDSENPVLEVVERSGKLAGVRLRDPKGEEMFIPSELVAIPRLRR